MDDLVGLQRRIAHDQEFSRRQPEGSQVLLGREQWGIPPTAPTSDHLRTRRTKTQSPYWPTEVATSAVRDKYQWGPTSNYRLCQPGLDSSLYRRMDPLAAPAAGRHTPQQK